MLSWTRNPLIISRYPHDIPAKAKEKKKKNYFHCREVSTSPFSKDSDKCVSVCVCVCVVGWWREKEKENVRAPIINMIQHGGLRYIIRPGPREREREMQMTHMTEGRVSDVMSGPIKDRLKAERRNTRR
jgi:hypothetical protein